MKVTSVRMILVIGVLAGLCFSVGEGLRLLPLPYTPSCPGGVADSGKGMTIPADHRQNQFKAGSMSLPPQAQKNLQCRQTHYAPPSGCFLPPPGQVARRQSARWRVGPDLSMSVPGSAGRAPPRTA